MDEVARVNNTEKARTGLSIESARIQDLVYSSLDVVQCKTNWSELDCRDVMQAGE